MNLKDMIYKRKSVRSYTDEPVAQDTLQKIREFCSNIKPLYEDIKVRADIVGRDQVKCFLPWTTPQLIAIFSEDKEGSLENVGFMYQQLDLYLQSLGLGVCWLGMGKMNREEAVADKAEEGLKYMIMLAFGYPKGKALRSHISEFKRKKLSEISDREDEDLEPARLAPSSVNSQPWHFVHEGEVIHAYCTHKGLFTNKHLGDMNRMDMGIALAHMYVANEETFQFFKAEHPKAIKDHSYIGSFNI